MRTIQELIRLSASYLEERKIEKGRRLAEELLSHLLGLKRIDLYLQFDRPVEEPHLVILRSQLKRIVQGEPVEYVMGGVEFLGCQIEVNPAVLIPRPETEILADSIGKRVRGKILWDLCTGSGALGISLKKKLPHLEVTLSDLSPEALALARRNAEKNGVEVGLLLGDLLAPFEGRRAEAIVCNPPYLSKKEYGEISPSVRDFEPQIALVAGDRGTEVYERLALEVPRYLEPGGQLFLEIGASQGESVQEIFQSPEWTKKELLKDWSGKDRFFFLEKQ